MKQLDDTATIELPALEQAPAPLTLLTPDVSGQDQGHSRTEPDARPEWRRVLDEAVEKDPQGKLGVSLRLGVSRVYVSRVMSGSIPQAPARFIDRVRTVLMVVDCPYLQRPLQPAECSAYASRSYSQVDQFEVAHWRACRGCPHNRVKAAATVTTPGADGGQA